MVCVGVVGCQGLPGLHLCLQAAGSTPYSSIYDRYNNQSIKLYQSTYIYLYKFFYLSIYLSSIYLSIYLSIYQPLSICLSICNVLRSIFKYKHSFDRQICSLFTHAAAFVCITASLGLSLRFMYKQINFLLIEIRI